MKKADVGDSPVSRRRFLRAAAVGGAIGAASPLPGVAMKAVPSTPALVPETDFSNGMQEAHRLFSHYGGELGGSDKRPVGGGSKEADDGRV